MADMLEVHLDRQLHHFMPHVDHFDLARSQKVILFWGETAVLHGWNPNCKVSNASR
ncbi:hypothetical protein [Mameliella sp.]|uniref:hypothetical protein n=1 Tax=Mameliella sp. TaxID=1924940 RepID=UPI003BAB446D